MFDKFSWVNTEENWVFRASAFAESVTWLVLFVESVGIPMASRRWDLMKDQNFFYVINQVQCPGSMPCMILYLKYIRERAQKSGPKTFPQCIKFGPFSSHNSSFWRSVPCFHLLCLFLIMKSRRKYSSRHLTQFDLKGLTMIFAGQENPFIIFGSKDIYICFKANNIITINLMK